MAAVAAWYGLDRAAEFAPIATRRGRQQAEAFTATAYDALTAPDRAFLWQQLDPEQERRLGYTPG